MNTRSEGGAGRGARRALAALALTALVRVPGALGAELSAYTDADGRLHFGAAPAGAEVVAEPGGADRPAGGPDAEVARAGPPEAPPHALAEDAPASPPSFSYAPTRAMLPAVDDRVRWLAAARALPPPAQPPAPAPARRGTLMGYVQLVNAAAHRYRIEPALLHALVTVESGYNPDAVSPRGARGLMQVMPETARRYGVSDLSDPAENLRAGSLYLRDLLAMFRDDRNLALAAYNAGENAVLRHGNRVPPYPETQSYVPRVMALYRQLLRLF